MTEAVNTINCESRLQGSTKRREDMIKQFQVPHTPVYLILGSSIVCGAEVESVSGIGLVLMNKKGVHTENRSITFHLEKALPSRGYTAHFTIIRL